jgi:hypothetical protein
MIKASKIFSAYGTVKSLCDKFQNRMSEETRLISLNHSQDLLVSFK